MALTASRVRVADLVSRQIPACSWLLKPDGRFHAAFGDTGSIFGEAAVELAGRSFYEQFERSERRPWKGRVTRVLSGDTISAQARMGGDGLECSITLFPFRGWAAGFAHVAYQTGAYQTAALSRVFRERDAERLRVCRRLHDDVGQCLSAAGLQLDLLRMDLAEAGFPALSRTAEIQAMLDRVMEVVRGITQDLDPGIAERGGLGAAIDIIARQLQPEFTGTLHLSADPTGPLSAHVTAAFCRIAEEAVRNAIRHAGCSDVYILIKSVRGRTLLEIRDGGRGFDPASAGYRGLGLLLMSQCAMEARLDLRITSAPDNGTVVRALARAARRLPLGEFGE
ncbi:MAG: histidine kinase [Bryobacteraceae bacterium]